MAIFKIFPEKDSSIYKSKPDINAGLDPILDLGITTEGPNRILVKYPKESIIKVLNKVIEDQSINNFQVYLKYFIANSSQIPLDFDVEVTPLSGSWDIGTGRLNDNINPKNGVTWNERKPGTNWDNSGGDLVDTNNVLYLNYIFTQSFNNFSERDLNVNVSEYMDRFYNSYINILSPYYNGIDYQGFLINIKDDLILSSSFNISYFSNNTHTIYHPYMEIRWDDSSYITGSLSLIDENKLFTINIQSDSYDFEQDSLYRFRLNIRDTHPARIFQSSSVYLDNKILPETTYYSLVDIKTNDTVIDFDADYSKISCDINGNFFDIYMDGLQPERYYKILIKIDKNNTSVIRDTNFIFKINR